MFSSADGNEKVEVIEEHYNSNQRDESKVAALLQEVRDGLLHRQTRKTSIIYFSILCYQ